MGKRRSQSQKDDDVYTAAATHSAHAIAAALTATLKRKGVLDADDMAFMFDMALGPTEVTEEQVDARHKEMLQRARRIMELFFEALSDGHNDRQS